MNTEDNQNNDNQSQGGQNQENVNPEDAVDAQDENIVNLEEAKVLTAEDQIAALQQELLEARDRTMRALADAENTRKRAVKDRDDAGKYAVANFARDMLAFGDNFGRAMQAMPEGTPPAVVEGLDAMDKEILSVFDRHGIKKITPLDEPFDANFHEVMFETPIPGKAAGIIIQVVEPGYVLNDRLLRAAKVGIAKAIEEPKDPGAKVDIQG